MSITDFQVANADSPQPATLPPVVPPLSVEHTIARVRVAEAIMAVAAAQQDPTDSALAGASDLALETLSESVIAAAITFRLDH